MSLRAWLRHYLETLTGAAALRVEVERLQHVQQLLERAREEAHCHMLEARALEAELVQVDSKRQALADTLHHTQAQASEASHALEVARETARAVHAELLESTSTGATWALGELAAMGKRVSQLEEECSALRADKEALRQQLSEAHAKQHSL